MSEELRSVLDLLVVHLDIHVSNAELADLLLRAYPIREGETRAATLGRIQAELDELFEGLIGSVLGPDET